MNERTYDRIHNEGGEGYNPYRAEREAREAEAMAADARAYGQTIQDKIDALHRRIRLDCGSVAREWGNAETINALESDLYREIKALKAERDADFLAVWGVDITQARRAEWNAMVTAGKFGRPGSGRVNTKAISAQERAQGWTMDQLKRAVKIHKDAGRIGR